MLDAVVIGAGCWQGLFKLLEALRRCPGRGPPQTHGRQNNFWSLLNSSSAARLADKCDRQ